ncbi:anaerobic sulfatase maturase [Planktothrix paucivesiculata]|uniref:Anaerobic sulfatase-maturating enzyme homolog AslB n=1 Tax=Planktothrix paucivesiculata PCC 9631 TaxID=671071 RepID=A0A7Z9BZN9_9CYAN|nr:anaerobic sulfatase maturase [Planktothrix paucivesiculata]VXD22529.1 Anaerobic sulfatase-maturating enzyme homolog AslB [Planktothrix paucivesiculata PCC 9631]
MLTLPKNAPPAFHLLAKPTGAICNLDCQYCFFLAKEQLYPGSKFHMTDGVLESYIQQLLESHQTPEVTVAWQGGEPTLMGLEFFERSLELVEKYKKPGQQIIHTLQTNGTKLDDHWGRFFKQHNFLIGLSVDGPQPLHDVYRVDKRGRGSFEQVMQGWKILKKHQVDFNILCTVNAVNGDHPVEVYRFFRDDLGAEFIQFIPIIERVNADGSTLIQSGNQVTERSVKPEQFGQFLIGIFDQWIRRDVGKIFIQHFDAALANWVGTQPGICIFSKTCGTALALEHNGDLYSCDHFVEPDYKLGNIQETPMIELIASEQQRQFGQAKFDSLPNYCRTCDVRFACHGGCPKNRFMETPDGEAGLNYLCAGYKAFFTHINQPMTMMAELLRQGRYADEVMQLLAKQKRQQKPVGFGKN